MYRRILLFLLLLITTNLFAVDVTVTGVSSHLNIREEPSTKSKILDSIGYRASAEFLGGEDDGWYKRKDETWYKIRYRDVTGWVKSDYLMFEFPAQLIITADDARLYQSGVFISNDHFPANTEKGDTVLATDEGYAPMKNIRTFTLDGGALIAMEDCRYLGPINDSELSRYSHTPFSVRLKLILILILIFVSIGLLFDNKNLKGIIFVVLTFAAEMWYLKTTSFNTWFVRPDMVGYIWTFINGIIFVMALIGQYLAVQMALSCFGIGGIVSDWAYKLGLFWCVMTGEVGIGFLAIPIIFVMGLIRHFSWSQVFYGFLGCVAWCVSLYYFGIIIDTFHSFFVWTIVFIIFGSLPASGAASNRQSFSGNRIHIQHSADGTPFYVDSESNRHTLYGDGGGNLLSDADGNSFDKDGWLH